MLSSKVFLVKIDCLETKRVMAQKLVFIHEVFFIYEILQAMSTARHKA